MVNFKVCRNGSSHLRGNVYVHYKNLDSAELAYYSVNARYFGGKQLQCEFVGVTKWKVAICGEYMKSKFTTCSRGTACNFIHCFHNPGGDYEWADWDKPPPKYWVKKMASLFGYSDESVYSKQTQEGSPRLYRDNRKIRADDTDRHRSWRSRSKESDYSRSSRNHSESYSHRSTHHQRGRSADRKQIEFNESSVSRQKEHNKKSSNDSDSDRDWSDRELRDRHDGSSRKRSRAHATEKLESEGHQCDGKRTSETISSSNLFDNDRFNYVYRDYARKGTKQREKRRGIQDEGLGDSLKGELSDEDGHNTKTQSGRMKSRQQKKLSKAPDDRWDDGSRMYDNDVDSDCSNGERGTYSFHIYNKKSSRSDKCEEFENDRSQIDSASILMDFVSQEYLGRQDDEVEQDNLTPGNHGWRCKSSESNAKKIIGKLGLIESEKQFPNHAKKSNRKRDGNGRSLDQKILDAVDHNGKKSQTTGFGSDESLDERGRWVPDEVG